MMRCALAFGLAAASLWGQANLDCNAPADVTIGSDARANLRFNATAGEAIYFRFVSVGNGSGFALVSRPIIADAFGNTNFATIRPGNAATRRFERRLCAPNRPEIRAFPHTNFVFLSFLLIGLPQNINPAPSLGRCRSMSSCHFSIASF